MSNGSERSGNAKYRYTVADCACEFCLFHSEEKGCSQDVCCCAEERRQALEREAKKHRRGQQKRGAPCHG